VIYKTTPCDGDNNNAADYAALFVGKPKLAIRDIFSGNRGITNDDDNKHN
jgi:hypothetical protein